MCEFANNGSECSLESSYSPGFTNICFDYSSSKEDMHFTGYDVVSDDNGNELKWNYSLEYVSITDSNGADTSDFLNSIEGNLPLQLSSDRTIQFFS
jgi:hypothetical protein